MAQISIVVERVFIPRIIMTPSETDFPFVLRRKQFHICPAYCITINKCQGQSLESVGKFIPSPDAIFSHGQLYVALSRVKNPKGLKVMVCGANYSNSGGVWIRNVVYREVFQNHNIIPSLNDTMDLSQKDISWSKISFSTADLKYHSEVDRDDWDPDSSQSSIPIRAAVCLTGTVNRFSLNMRTQLGISIDLDPELIAAYEKTYVNIFDSC